MRAAPAVISWILASALSLAACADDHETEPSSGVDACEHFANGPARAVSAGASGPEAVDASQEHTRFDLTLPGAAAPYVGFVEVAIAQAGDHVFFFDGPVEVAVTDAGGAVVSPEDSATSDPDCATVERALTLELAVGTYAFEVTSVTPEVSLVWFPSSDGHDH